MATYYGRLTPLAKQSPADMSPDGGRPVIKKRGITVLSPQSTNAAITYTQAPLADGYTLYWDQPDFNMKKLRPRYDGQAHIIPKGVGLPRRISK